MRKTPPPEHVIDLATTSVPVRDVTLQDLADRNPERAVNVYSITIHVPSDKEPKRRRIQTVLHDLGMAVVGGVITLWVLYYWPELLPPSIM